MKVWRVIKKVLPSQLKYEKSNYIVKSKWKSEKEHLEREIINENKTYEEIGKEYGCSGSNIKKVAIRLGIKIPKRRKANTNDTFNHIIKIKKHKCLNCGKEFKHISGYTIKYCSERCEKEYKHKQRYQLIIEGNPSIMRANYSPKAFREDILREQDGVCAICGIKPEWNNRKLVFIIDHIDGKASNNKRANLRCICPNCDSQLETYKSKNKESERYYYRYCRHK